MAAIIVIGGGSAALLAYSMGALAMDEFGLASRPLVSISLLSAGFIALLLVVEFLGTFWTAASHDDGPQRESLMHQITKADVVISVGRGLIMAAAIVGATYYFGSWYLGGEGLEALFHGVDDKIAVSIESTITTTTEATQ
ncbi:hypothetical protein RPMA_21245 [Tardiphaga alba]|uniref:Uncharacterized protein n=1 Tax=Tardiphaga alba TaxID=340268 RepID=A0ABX8AC61_9BRAD|nr:hypothetical protein [Tardiphaga alba]QUS41087.1 hypothetical protein RPMA_21245 [Tardiphaga alba]